MNLIDEKQKKIRKYRKNSEAGENFSKIKKIIGKMKTKWKGRFFFEKNLRIQVDRVLDSESNGGIFDSLTPTGGELLIF